MFNIPGDLHGFKPGAGPSITSNISVRNLMRRCEWILKQVGEAPRRGPRGASRANGRFK